MFKHPWAGVHPLLVIILLMIMLVISRSALYSATGKELGVQTAHNSDTDKELGAHPHMIALLVRNWAYKPLVIIRSDTDKELGAHPYMIALLVRS